MVGDLICCHYPSQYRRISPRRLLLHVFILLYVIARSGTRTICIKPSLLLRADIRTRPSFWSACLQVICRHSVVLVKLDKPRQEMRQERRRPQGQDPARPRPERPCLAKPRKEGRGRTANLLCVLTIQTCPDWSEICGSS